MADTSSIRKFKSAEEYTKNFIIRDEINKYLPGGKHFIDDDYIKRTIAEAEAGVPDKEKIR